ncbi:hypothetical protein ACIRQH_02575 [Streptomyces sp. NPDC102279]|uniref:hypothetical protein n=1 Tax=Streptomyces sp. NPDC102279 TaxID=3366153 RepID=UPI00380E6828
MAGFAMPDDEGDLTGVPRKEGYEKVKWLSQDQLSEDRLTKEKRPRRPRRPRVRRLELGLP